MRINICWGDLTDSLAKKAALVQMRDGLMGLEPLPIEEDPRSIMRIPKEGRLRSTVMSMLSREPASRPSAAKVVQSIHDCIKELTGESPLEADDASPISSIHGSTSVDHAR